MKRKYIQVPVHNSLPPRGEITWVKYLDGSWFVIEGIAMTAEEEATLADIESRAEGDAKTLEVVEAVRKRPRALILGSASSANEAIKLRDTLQKHRSVPVRALSARAAARDYVLHT